MNAGMIGLSVMTLALALFIGHILRTRIKFFYAFFIPSSIIAGLLLLLVGPEVLGVILPNRMAYGLFNESMLKVFSSIPGLLITIIFAGLFLGKKTPNFKNMMNVSGPQIAYGQTAAWGQYVVGILIAFFILVPFFDSQIMTGALIEIGFEGGHGTAAGLAGTFDDLGFSEGTDIALGLATVGVVSGLMIGVFLINWAVKNNRTAYLKNNKDVKNIMKTGIIPIDNREKTIALTVSKESIEPLALHLGLYAIAVFIGILLLEGIKWIELNTWAKDGGIILLGHIPLFPLAMIGGVIAQSIVNRFDKNKVIDRLLINRIQGLALDFLIVSALASLSISVIIEHIGVFSILAIAGIAWNLFVFLFLARRMIPKYWFERGIGDYGQSMGMTAIGLILIRIVDSDNKTPSLEAFGYKQLFFEPLVGGGFVTAMSVPLLYNFGPWPLFIISAFFLLFFLLLGLFYFGKLPKTTQDEL